MEGRVHKEKSSFVHGTNDSEACPRRWIAVLVQVNCEKRTATRLSKAGYETYIPIQQELRQWSDRKKIIDCLIMPMVVFVRVASGPLKGLEGVVYENDEKSSMLGVEINGLGCACVKIARNYLIC